jgi:hypothetical protein
MHPEGSSLPSSASPASRTAPRGATLKKPALPRAYMAARAGARRERSAQPRTGSTQPIDASRHARDARAEARADADTSSGSAGASTEPDVGRRDEITAARPNAWVARRASQEGMTGPRAATLPRAGLAGADRLLLAGLMLMSSVLVAVLTSTLTVRGMQRSGAPPAAAAVAARAETTVTVAAAPSIAARDTATAARGARTTDSVLVAGTTTHALDNAPAHEEAGGSVAPPPAISPRLSPMPAQTPRDPTRESKREPARVERRAASLAEHVRAIPPKREPVARSTASPQLLSTTQRPASTQPSISTSRVADPTAVPISSPATSSSATSSPAMSAPVTSAPVSTTPAAPPATVNNAQFLEELRAIHAEIDARKKHMDSLTASLDSLKRIKP